MSASTRSLDGLDDAKGLGASFLTEANDKRVVRRRGSIFGVSTVEEERSARQILLRSERARAEIVRLSQAMGINVTIASYDELTPTRDDAVELEKRLVDVKLQWNKRLKTVQVAVGIDYRARAKKTVQVAWQIMATTIMVPDHHQLSLPPTHHGP